MACLSHFLLYLCNFRQVAIDNTAILCYDCIVSSISVLLTHRSSTITFSTRRCHVTRTTLVGVFIISLIAIALVGWMGFGLTGLIIGSSISATVATSGIREVDAGTWEIVQLFGKPWSILNPGLSWTVPLIETTVPVSKERDTFNIEKTEAVTTLLDRGTEGGSLEKNALITIVYREISILWNYKLTKDNLEQYFNYSVETLKEKMRDAVQSTIKSYVDSHKNSGLFHLVTNHNRLIEIVREVLEATCLSEGAGLQTVELSDTKNIQIKPLGLPIEIQMIEMNKAPEPADPKIKEALNAKPMAILDTQAEEERIARELLIVQNETKRNIELARAYGLSRFITDVTKTDKNGKTIVVGQTLSDEAMPMLLQLKGLETLNTMAKEGSQVSMNLFGESINLAASALGKAISGEKK